VFGHPALRLLFGLKLRGGLRLQARRLRRPSSWMFLGLGLLLVGAWLAALVLDRGAGAPAVSDDVTHVSVRAGLLLLVVLTLLGAGQFRGLYLPREEIELAFSAPIDRQALVRYRLGVNLFRSLFAAVFFGFLVARRMPVPAFAFAGTFLVMMTLPVVGQGAALFLGASENRLGRLVRHAPLKLLSGVLGGALGLLIVLLAFGGLPGAEEHVSVDEGLLPRLARDPWVRAALLPLTPWAGAITAASLSEFLPWFAVGVGAWVLLFELVVRARVDYRELSLATSAEVAKRLAQARRGGWAASRSGDPAGARTRGAPWVFGRGAFGAIAWLEATSMLRRARGTILLSLLVIAFIVFLSHNILAGRDLDPESRAQGSLVIGTVLISLFGTGYLCAGLKFDFRGRLEHMEQVRVWPVAPWRVFLATILPEVVYVTCLIWGAILAQAAWIGAWHPALVAALLFQPLLVLTWVALDNAVFLRAPVRYVPGQESALQSMGRAIVLMLLRALVLVVALGVAVLPGVGAGLTLAAAFGLSRGAAVAVGGVVAWLGILAVAAALVWAGGRILARFDVARDRGA
jgi:hypothetical protein